MHDEVSALGLDPSKIGADGYDAEGYWWFGPFNEDETVLGGGEEIRRAWRLWPEGFTPSYLRGSSETFLLSPRRRSK